MDVRKKQLCLPDAILEHEITMKLPNDLLSGPSQLKIERWDINGEQLVAQISIRKALAQFEVMAL